MAPTTPESLPDFPNFDQPMLEPWPLKVPWSDAIQRFKAVRDRYLLEFDSPERRFADKNPEPFVLD